MKKIFMMFILLVLATGCLNTGPSTYPQYETDQKLRQKLFFKCLKLIPKGPEKTRYNDWDEVVSQCATVAFRLAQVCYENCNLKK